MYKLSRYLPVNKNDGKDGGPDIDGTNDSCVEKGGVLAITKHVKELGGVEHDGVDTGELLEEGDHNGANLQQQTEAFSKNSQTHRPDATATAYMSTKLQHGR